MPRTAALIDAVTSPSWISLIRAPAALISSIRSWCRGRSRTIAVMSLTIRSYASAIARMLSPTGRVRSIWPRARGPTAIFRMYMSGSDGIEPRGAAAIIEIAFVPPRATTARPSSGSSARSNSSPPAPMTVPAASCSASSCAPITTLPLIGICSSAFRAAVNDASSAASLSARPSHRAPGERRPLGHARERLALALRPVLLGRRGLAGRLFDLRHRGSRKRSAASITSPITPSIARSTFAFSTTGTPSRLRAARDVRLDPADVVDPLEVLVHRAAAAGRAVADVEVQPVHVLVGDLEHDVDEQRAVERARDEPGDEVHALEDHRPAFGQRPVQRRVDADADVAALLDEADHRRVARHLLVERLARLEARVVDRRHELRREERAHRLPDEVGRRDAVDPEPVRDLDRDRGLSRPGRAADHHDHRHVELLQVRQPTEPVDGALTLRLAEHLAREHVEPLERRRGLPRLGEVELDPPREPVRLVGRDARRDQRPRHQALRVRQVLVAERQRLGVARLRHQATLDRRQRKQRLVVDAFHVVAGEHDTDAARERVCRDDIDPGRLHLDEIRVRIDEIVAQPCAVRQVRRDVHDVGVEMRDVGRARGEHRDATLERLGRTESKRGRSTTTSEMSRRYVSRYGSRSARPVTRTRRAVATGGIAAPLPSKSTRSGRRSAARRAPAATFEIDDAARQTAARSTAADRRHARERRDLEMVGRGVAAGLRAGDELLDGRRRLDELRLRRTAAAHRDDDDAPVAREEASQVRGDRGLPDPLPGPDHRDRRQLERLELRRVEPEIGADVREPGRERPRRPLEPLERAEHGLVRQVDDDLRGAEAVDERDAVVAAALRAASRSRRRGSLPPTRTGALRARRAPPADSAHRR